MSTEMAVEKKEARKASAFLNFTTWQLTGIVAAIAVWVILTYVVATPEGLSKAGWDTAKIMFMMVCLWVTDALPAGICAFLMVVLLAVTGATDWSAKDTGATKISNALSGFSGREMWLIASAFILGIALVDSGLGRRITYAVMSIKMFAQSFSRFMLGFCLVQWIMAPFVPSSTAKSGIFVPLANGVIDGLGIKPYAETGKHSNNAAALMIHTAWMTNSVGSMFATGTAGVVAGLGILSAVSKESISWGGYALAMVPPTLCIVLGSFYVLIKMFPPEIKAIPGGAEAAHERYKELGPLTAVEKRTLFILAATLLAWIFEKQTGLNTTTTAMMACLLLMAPGIGVGVSAKEILNKKMGWDAILLLGAGFSLAAAMTKTGCAVWLGKVAFGGLGLATWSPLAVIAFFCGFMFISHFGFCSATAHKLALMPMVLTAASAVGFNPVWIALPVAVASTHSFVLHTMSPPNMIAYGTGHFPLNDMIKSGLVVTVLAWVILSVFAVVWFPLAGVPIYK